MCMHMEQGYVHAYVAGVCACICSRGMCMHMEQGYVHAYGAGVEHVHAVHMLHGGAYGAGVEQEYVHAYGVRGMCMHMEQGYVHACGWVVCMGGFVCACMHPEGPVCMRECMCECIWTGAVCLHAYGLGLCACMHRIGVVCLHAGRLGPPLGAMCTQVD